MDLAAGDRIRWLESGTDPEQLALDAEGGRLFVSNEDASALSIVDVATGRVLQTLPVGEEPEGQ